MKIVVIGGKGHVGSRLVSILTRGGHEVMAASRRSGVDVVTGDGLSHALQGAAVVVDVANAPSYDEATAMTFFTTSTRTLLAAETAAGVGHHVALSLAGADDLPGLGYFRAKRAQEDLIAASPLPYSLVRSTQFFEFLDTIADAETNGGVVRVPPVRVQPIAAEDVARALSSVATGPPLNRTTELGGPEPFYLVALIQRILGARHDPRMVIADRHAPYFGAIVGERALVAGDEADLGEIRFEQWLDRAGRASLAAHRPASAGDVAAADVGRAGLQEHEFRISDVPPGSVLILGDVAVFSVEGGFCATQASCPHRQGPLSEGTIDGSTVTCPLHGAGFNVWTGAVLRGPATTPLKTYSVIVKGDVGRVEVPLEQEA